MNAARRIEKTAGAIAARKIQPVRTDIGHKRIEKLKTPKAETYGTYYPASDPNGLPCLIIRQTESGRWLILDLSPKSLTTDVENAGGGTYYFTLEARFRTVDGKKLTTATSWMTSEAKEGYQVTKPFYLSFSASIK